MATNEIYYSVYADSSRGRIPLLVALAPASSVIRTITTTTERSQGIDGRPYFVKPNQPQIELRQLQALRYLGVPVPQTIATDRETTKIVNK